MSNLKQFIAKSKAQAEEKAKFYAQIAVANHSDQVSQDMKTHYGYTQEQVDQYRQRIQQQAQ